MFAIEIRTEIHHSIEILTGNPLKYKMDNYKYVWDNPSE